MIPAQESDIRIRVTKYILNDSLTLLPNTTMSKPETEYGK